MTSPVSQEEALLLVQSLNPGDFSQIAVAIADQIYNDVANEQRAPFLQTTITEHLFIVLSRFYGREFNKNIGPVYDILFNVTGSIFQICSHHDESCDLIMTRSNAEIFFKVMKADKTNRRAVAANCFRIILLAITSKPTDAALHRLYLADSRFTNGVVDFLQNCEDANNIRFFCEALLGSLDPSITAHTSFISSLKNHPRIIPALQNAVGGSNKEECVVMKLARILLGEDVSKLKSFSQLQQEALYIVQSLKPGDFLQNAVQIAVQICDNVQGGSDPGGSDPGGSDPGGSDPHGSSSDSITQTR